MKSTKEVEVDSLSADHYLADMKNTTEVKVDSLSADHYGTWQTWRVPKKLK